MLNQHTQKFQFANSTQDSEPLFRGWVGFDKLSIPCIIGVYPEERVKEQTILITLAVEVDMKACVFTDGLQQTFDYEELAALCQEIATEGKYNLLEKLGWDILGVLRKDERVLAAKIRIDKPFSFPSVQGSFVELELKK